MEIVRVRVPDDLLLKLDELKERTGLNRSQVIREILTERKPHFVCEEHQEMRQAAFRHVAKAGNNINQIAHILNLLNLKKELDYGHCISYLRLLDNIHEELRRVYERGFNDY